MTEESPAGEFLLLGSLLAEAVGNRTTARANHDMRGWVPAGGVVRSPRPVVQLPAPLDLRSRRHPSGSPPAASGRGEGDTASYRNRFNRCRAVSSSACVM